VQRYGFHWTGDNQSTWESLRLTTPMVLGLGLSGIAFTAAYIIYFKFVNPTANVAANWLWGISPEGIGTIGMLVNFVVLIVVSKFTKEPPADVQNMVANLRYPREVS